MNKYEQKLSELILPPHFMLKDIQFWMSAPTNDFEKIGIDKGDLLGCINPKSEDAVVDEPRDIYVINYRGDVMLARINYHVNNHYLIIRNEGETDVLFLNEKEFDLVHIIGIVKLVLKDVYLGDG